MERLGSLFLLLVFVGSGLAHAGESIINRNGKALAVYQRVGLAADGYPSSTIAHSGTLQVQGGVSTLSGSSTTLPSGIVGNLPYLPYNSGSLYTQSQWIGIAANWFPYQYNIILKPGILPYMQAHGYSSAMFDYAQRVLVSASPSPVIKWLSWRVIIDSTGRARYADPKLLDEAPQILYVTYTPLAVANGLPAGYAYPNAGKIVWNMMDASGNATTSTTTVDVNGAYDEPQAAADATPPLPAGCTADAAGVVSCDPDFGLKCLINNQSDPTCPQGYTDVRQLMDSTAAAQAIVDYTRMVQPVYTDVLQPDGSYISYPQTTISIDSRTWVAGKRVFFIASGGADQFSETGSYGFLLQLQTDRYQVNPDLFYLAVGAQQTQAQSPTQAFSKTVTVPAGATCAGYTYNVIDPYSTNQVYDWRSDTVNNLPPSAYINVAPLSCY